VHVAKINQRSWISKLAFHKEVSDSDRVVVACLLDDFLNISKPVQSGTGFNILEIDIRIIGVREDVAQEMQKAIVDTERFKHLDRLLGIDLTTVLYCDVGAKRSVRSWVGAHQLV
jgi:hypothetical protein